MTLLTSRWEAPAPILLNPWKHHAGALRHRIRETVQAGDPALPPFAQELVVIGAELMDLYTGRLSPAAIGEGVLAQLRSLYLVQLPAYRTWLAEGGGYRVLTLAEDASQWVLRLGNEGDRYVHVHPGRWTPQTLRVRANVLKTAVLVSAYTGVHGGDPLDVALVNDVRRRYLGLSPIGKLAAGDQSIASLIDELQGPDTGL
jgi:hypothetical protein